ncbi:hypothetical protein DFH27DRAFT_523301 [Peziza echinospora]|nr:hypothetical protein DFH27DRAFT_523301 [Peziza echinospora]
MVAASEINLGYQALYNITIIICLRSPAHVIHAIAKDNEQFTFWPAVPGSPNPMWTQTLDDKEGLRRLMLSMAGTKTPAPEQHWELPCKTVKGNSQKHHKRTHGINQTHRYSINYDSNTLTGLQTYNYDGQDFHEQQQHQFQPYLPHQDNRRYEESWDNHELEEEEVHEEEGEDAYEHEVHGQEEPPFVYNNEFAGNNLQWFLQGGIEERIGSLLVQDNDSNDQLNMDFDNQGPDGHVVDPQADAPDPIWFPAYWPQNDINQPPDANPDMDGNEHSQTQPSVDEPNGSPGPDPEEFREGEEQIQEEEVDQAAEYVQQMFPGYNLYDLLEAPYLPVEPDLGLCLFLLQWKSHFKISVRAFKALRRIMAIFKLLPSFQIAVSRAALHSLAGMLIWMSVCVGNQDTRLPAFRSMVKCYGQGFGLESPGNASFTFR